MCFIEDLEITNKKLLELGIGLPWFTFAKFGISCRGEKFELNLTPDEKKVLSQAAAIIMSRHR